MSEFKFACPVCGQHIKCDSSQAGTQMSCPTCFQKITVPQAPEGEQKFVLTGTKKGERPLPIATGLGTTPLPPKSEGVSGALIVIVILIFIGMAVAFVYRGTIFRKPVGKNSPLVTATNQPPKRFVQTNAPPASNTNWMLDLSTIATPDAPAAGRIHGGNFLCQRAGLQDGTLTIRAGTRGPLELGIIINFNGAAAQALAGQTINVTTNAPRAARVVLRWTKEGEKEHETFSDSYAMRLEFGQIDGNHMPAKIYLCLPDVEKSYVAGTFTVEIYKPRPRK